MEKYLLERLKEFKLPKIPWLKSTVDLVEFVYGLDAVGAFPPNSKSKAMKDFEQFIDIHVENHRIIFHEIKRRKDPAKFLNEMAFALTEKVRYEKNSKKLRN